MKAGKAATGSDSKIRTASHPALPLPPFGRQSNKTVPVIPPQCGADTVWCFPCPPAPHTPFLPWQPGNLHVFWHALPSGCLCSSVKKDKTKEVLSTAGCFSALERHRDTMVEGDVGKPVNYEITANKTIAVPKFIVILDLPSLSLFPAMSFFWPWCTSRQAVLEPCLPALPFEVSTALSAFSMPDTVVLRHHLYNFEGFAFPLHSSCISLAFFGNGGPPTLPMPLLRKGLFQKVVLCSKDVCPPFNFPLQRFQSKRASASPGCFTLSAVNASLVGVFGYGAQGDGVANSFPFEKILQWGYYQ